MRLRSLRYAVRTELASHRLTFPLLRLRPGGRWMVSARSDVCIEGFARSGNTFAFHSFKQWNPDLLVAHHTHVAGQARRAVRLGVPCAVVLRRAVDTIASVMIFGRGELALDLVVRAYLRYLGAIRDLGDEVVLCGFEELVADPTVVPRRLNDRFGTSFRWEAMSEDTKRDLLATIERYHRNRNRDEVTFSVPSAVKEEQKAEVKRRVAAHPRIADAEALYRELSPELRVRDEQAAG